MKPVGGVTYHSQIIKGYFIIEDGYILWYGNTKKELVERMLDRREPDYTTKYGRKFSKMKLDDKIDYLIGVAWIDAYILLNPTLFHLNEAIQNEGRD
tara:strand:- start:1546 stop:1836 length:291 start_codon:yes stop_codon:yes gene_type:complete